MGAGTCSESMAASSCSRHHFIGLELVRVVLHRHWRCSRLLRIKQIQYQRVHPSGRSPLRQLVAYQCTRERFTGRSRVCHPLAHLAEVARTIARAATATLVEADAGIQKYRQGPPGSTVAPPRRREGGTHMNQRLGTARAEPVVVTKVRLLVGGPTGQADIGGLRVGHAGQSTARPG